MRNDEWLEKRLEKIWQILIPDVERLNQVSICFRGRWKTKFGDIKKLKDSSTRISINGLFRYEEIPDYVIDTTIAHELIHYMHGFSSPHQKQFNHPHKGGIVNKELKKRGFELMLNLEKKWVRENWEKVILPLKENAYTFYNSNKSIRPSYF